MSDEITVKACNRLRSKSKQKRICTQSECAVRDELTEVIDKLRNQYNAAVLVNTKQADEIKDLQNRYAESSMLFQGDIKELAEALTQAADDIESAHGFNMDEYGASDYGDKARDLANKHIGDK